MLKLHGKTKSFITAAVLGGLIASPALALDKTHSSKGSSSSGSSSSSSSHSSSGATVTVTPDSLRKMILNDNTSVLTSLNNVYQSKASVNKSRANLLPSLNLGVGVSPSFALSSISFLLPFLVPSNWYNLDASKHQLTADGFAYYITELNTYASALSLYMTIQGDQDLRNVYEQQYENYQKIYQLTQNDYNYGLKTQADVRQAASQMELARVQVSQIDELLIQEKASIRQLMALPFTATINFAPYHLPQLSSEDSSAQRIYAKIEDETPEVMQINSLIAAARDEKFAAAWGWLGGPTLSVSGTDSAGGFGKVSSGVPMNLGFGIFPTVEISSLNVDQLRIKAREVDTENAELIESAWGSLTEAETQLDQGSAAYDDAKKYFEDTLASYNSGTVDLLHVIQAANSETEAGVDRAKAQVDVDNQRVNMARIMRTGPFAPVPTCNISMDKQRGGGIIGFFKRIFGGKHADIKSVDQMCKPGNAEF